LAINKLGNPTQATENLKAAARLGFKQAQDDLEKQGTKW
jgi:hypothetical protein